MPGQGGSLDMWIEEVGRRKGMSNSKGIQIKVKI
jgi:hypothetical protein